MQVSDVYISKPVKVVFRKWVECIGGCTSLNRDVWDLGSQIEEVLPNVLNKENIKYTYLPNSHQFIIHNQYGIIMFDMRYKFHVYHFQNEQGIAVTIVGIATVEKLNDMIEFIKSVLTKIGIDYTDFEVDFEIETN
jgi:hypothetical protein